MAAPGLSFEDGERKLPSELEWPKAGRDCPNIEEAGVAGEGEEKLGNLELSFRTPPALAPAADFLLSNVGKELR